MLNTMSHAHLMIPTEGINLDESDAAACSRTGALVVSALPMAVTEEANGMTIMNPMSCVDVIAASGALRCILADAAAAQEPPPGIDELERPVALLMRYISHRQPEDKGKGHFP